MLKLIRYILFILFAVILINCASTRKSGIPRNLQMIYNPLSSTFHPKMRLYNISDTSSVLVEKLYSNELLYNLANDENKLIAKIKVRYNLYNLDRDERLRDSSTTFYRFAKDTKVKYNIVEIPVKAKIGNNYVLEVITTDLNRNNNQYSILKVERAKKLNQQDFIMRDTASDEIIVDQVFNSSVKFSFEHYKLNFDSLNVYFFSKDDHVPLPPYEKDSINYKFTIPDTTWICYTDSIIYDNFTDEGVYYFTKDSSPINGFALKQFGDDFPNVRTPEKLIKPLSYLGFHDTIPISDSSSKYTKLAVDNFWLNKANNIDKSRDLIKVYYNRLVNANKYFTSFIEGWQTDRGMIYIIYGLPDYVFKSDKEEKWIYNAIDLGPGIVFTFKYYENPFSLNHYILDRKKLKSTGWNDAINIWNKGEVIYYQN